MLTEAVG